MELQIRVFCLLLFLLSLLSGSQAYTFYVGAKDGWVLYPSENYNHWAERLRFQVSDTLVFKYKKGSDSVLVVNKEDYEKCNKKNPIKKFEDGNSEFQFDRSGPFYFISGKDDYCEKGQKLIIVVLAVREPPPYSPTPPKTPYPPHLPPKAPSPSYHPPHLPSPIPSPTHQPPFLPITPSPFSQSPYVQPPPKTPSPTSQPPSNTPSPTSQPPYISTPPSTAPSPYIPKPPNTPSPTSQPPSPNAPTPYPNSPITQPPSSASSPTSSSPYPSTIPPSYPPSPFAPATTPSTASPPIPSPATATSPPAPLPAATSPSPSSSSGSSSNETTPSRPNGASSISESRFGVYSLTILVGAALSTILG